MRIRAKAGEKGIHAEVGRLTVPCQSQGQAQRTLMTKGIY